VVTSDTLGCPSYWPEGTGAVLIRSGSSAYGGILAADGNQLLGLPSVGVYQTSDIKQPVTLALGFTYVLSFFAASQRDSVTPLGVSVGDASMTVDFPLQYESMAVYTMRFVADASSRSIIFRNNFGLGMVFVDFVTLRKGKIYIRKLV